MADVVEINRLALVGARNPFDREIEHPRNRDRASHTGALDPNRLGLGTRECADERPERGHRASALAAGYRRQRFPLLRGSALVEHQADRPVALDHGTRRVRQYREIEPVEGRAAVTPALDMEYQPHVARALCGSRRQAGRRARTHRVTAARLEIFAADLP